MQNLKRNIFLFLGFHANNASFSQVPFIICLLLQTTDKSTTLVYVSDSHLIPEFTAIIRGCEELWTPKSNVGIQSPRGRWNWQWCCNVVTCHNRGLCIYIYPCDFTIHWSRLRVTKLFSCRPRTPPQALAYRRSLPGAYRMGAAESRILLVVRLGWARRLGLLRAREQLRCHAGRGLPPGGPCASEGVVARDRASGCSTRLQFLGLPVGAGLLYSGGTHFSDPGGPSSLWHTCLSRVRQKQASLCELTQTFFVDIQFNLSY